MIQQRAAENEPNLDQRRARILALYRKLTPEQKRAVHLFTERLIQQDEAAAERMAAV